MKTENFSPRLLTLAIFELPDFILELGNTHLNPEIDTAYLRGREGEREGDNGWMMIDGIAS